MEQQFEQNNTPTPLGVGAQLKAAREAADMSLGEVADRLKLSMRQLGAIERDEFDSLPGATFVRGFVRNYAKFLGIDPEPLMHALDQQFPSAVTEVANLVKHGETHEPVATPSLPESGGAGAGFKWLGVAVLLAVVGGGAAWYFSQSGSAKPEVASNDLAPMLTEQQAASAPHEASAAAMAPALPAAPTASAAAAVVAAPKPQASSPALVVAKPLPKPVASAAAAKPASAKLLASAPLAVGSDKVALNVKEASWVSIQDANGRKLVYQVLQPGERKEVTGTAPFKVIVGNASQVELSYNGQAVDFSDKIRGTTAKIELK